VIFMLIFCVTLHDLYVCPISLIINLKNKKKEYEWSWTWIDFYELVTSGNFKRKGCMKNKKKNKKKINTQLIGY
jgi:hypothetical protein